MLRCHPSRRTVCYKTTSEYIYMKYFYLQIQFIFCICCCFYFDIQHLYKTRVSGIHTGIHLNKRFSYIYFGVPGKGAM